MADNRSGNELFQGIATLWGLPTSRWWWCCRVQISLFSREPCGRLVGTVSFFLRLTSSCVVSCTMHEYCTQWQKCVGSSSHLPVFLWKVYRGPGKGLFMVGRNVSCSCLFFSAWPGSCLARFTNLFRAICTWWLGKRKKKLLLGVAADSSSVSGLWAPNVASETIVDVSTSICCFVLVIFHLWL